MKRLLKLNVNGEYYQVEAEPNETLLEILRNNIGLTGTKYSCGTGECGACSVIMNGKPILSCLTLARFADRKKIITIEGLAKKGRLHPIQKAFIDHGATQCGYCTPGFIIMAKALLDNNPNPTEQEIRDYIRGNLCRCTGYVKIVEAILSASQKLRRKRTL